MEAEDHFLIMIKVTFSYFPQESHEFLTLPKILIEYLPCPFNQKASLLNDGGS